MEYVYIHIPTQYLNMQFLAKQMWLKMAKKNVLLEISLIRSLCINLISNVNKLTDHVFRHEYTYILPKYDVPYINIESRNGEDVNTLEGH